MGRKGKWLIAVKRVFSPESKEKKSEKTHKSEQNSGFGKCKNFDLDPSESLEDTPHHDPNLASAVAAEAAVIAAQAAAEVDSLTTSTKFSDRSREEVAAIKIQTAFRGYLARRALRALRGMGRLKSLTNSNSVKRQAAATLHCMQTLARVQSQIHSRRIRMSEENQALQRQLQLKRERELEKLRMAEEWDDSFQSKEQMEASLQNRQEAAIRRERALAYAFSRQWKNSSRSVNPMFMDPNNPQWGWSWLERWMAARPWEGRSAAADKDLNSDRASVKSISRSVTGGETAKSNARRDTNSERQSPLAQKSSRHSPSTPPSKPPSVVGKVKLPSLRSGCGLAEDDSRSIPSMQSERPRRHSIAGLSVTDEESLASSLAIPSYMAPTGSARARSRIQSPSSSNKIGTISERGPVSSAVKKRLSFPADGVSSMTRVRRHSGSPKVDVTSLTSNGGSR